MPELQVAHTAWLTDDDRQAIRRLLIDAFAGDVTDDDVEHAYGGVHVLLWGDAGLVAHASVVMRRLMHGGRAWRAGYVEAVAVRPELRRRGHGSVVMAEVERVISRAYDFGALGSSDEGVPFYLSRGWSRWPGPLSALTPTGTLPTAEEAGYVFVFPGSGPPPTGGELTCDWRDGDVW